MVIAEVIDLLRLLGFIDVREVTESETSFEEFDSFHFHCLAFWIEFLEDSAILTKDVIDVANIVIRVALELVIIG